MKEKIVKIMKGEKMSWFVSKEGKKVLQKVCENKDKDVELWKYMLRRELATFISTCILMTYIIEVTNKTYLSLELRVITFIYFVYIIIKMIGAIIRYGILIAEHKEESEK